MKIEDVIHGKDKTKRVVALEVKDEQTKLFIADGNKTTTEIVKNEFYVILDKYYDTLGSSMLDGKNDMMYFNKFRTKSERYNFTSRIKDSQINFFCPWNEKESFQYKSGVTLYKDMKHTDVSVMSFDIETTGLQRDKNSYILLISNTFRGRDGKIEKKLFAFDDYDSPKQFIEQWCKWFKEKDPDVVTGHNIFGFDLPYLRQFCMNYGAKLSLGRFGHNVKFASNTSEFRKDGSQTYSYNNCDIYGREIVDTFFLSIKYDIGRNYPSYRLKSIISYEGLEKQDRQFYDASQIYKDYLDPAKWKKIKHYAIDDADDSLALFDLMIPSFFYLCQTMPRTLQQVINRASGGMLDGFMKRAYIQQGQALPKSSPRAAYEGAISFGNPGIYEHVYKVDVASLYPSIMIQNTVCNEKKDPQRIFPEVVKYFTEERLRNKKLASDTGDRYYDDLQSSQKIVINSFYGFLGATGCLFNSPEHAAFITRQGREILTKSIKWAEDMGFTVVNGDTDSISFTGHVKLNNFEKLISNLNDLYPDRIKWEDDGYYEKFIVVKAKNYILKSEGKVKIKGSGLKATMKEPALKEMLNDMIYALVDGKDLQQIYRKYIKEACNIKDIKRWSSKKTVTKAVLNPKRTNEQKILDALKGIDVNEGDKIHVFFKKDKSLAVSDNFDGDYCVKTMLKKIFNTVKVFEKILDIKQYNNYSLKRNGAELQKLTGR